MNLKKIISFITATIMISLFCIGDTSTIQYFKSKIVASAEETYSGFCGENCTYSFDSSTGTLTISGTGDMDNYSSSKDIPWYDFKDDIKSVIIGSYSDIITSIGSYAFSMCTSLKSCNAIVYGTNSFSINAHAFDGCTALTYAPIGSADIIGEYAFNNCTSLSGNITISDSITIGKYAFNNCTSISSVSTYNDNYYNNLFNVQNIYVCEYAFNGCDSLSCLMLNANKVYLEDFAFINCKSLKYIGISIGIEGNIGNLSLGYMNNNGLLTKIPDVIMFSYYDLNGQYICPLLENYAFGRDFEFMVVNIMGTINNTTYMFSEEKGTLIIIGNEVLNLPSSIQADLVKSVIVSANGPIHTRFSSFPNIESAKILSCYQLEPATFSECIFLKTVQLPNNLDAILDSTFRGCTSLESVTFSNSVRRIAPMAFAECTSLSDIYFKGTKEDFSLIDIDQDNSALVMATIHYIYDMEDVTEPEEPIVTEPPTTTEPPVTTTEPPVTTTEPSTETKDNTIIFGEDNWNILNQCSYFGQDGNDYYISKEDYAKLWSNLSNIEKVYIKDYKNSSWQGSCYGMAVTEILAKNGIFSTKDWFNSADCLSQLPTLDPEENSVEESLINYYQMLQLTIEVQQEITNTLCNKEQSEVLEELIELSSNVSNGGSPVLLCYTGEGFGAHAVVSYGVTYGQYNIDNISYNGRVLILDPNYNLKFENNACLYFNTNDDSWTIPTYDLKSDNGDELCLVTNNMDLLNNKGYFSNVTDSFTNDNKYISILNMNNTNSNSYIDKVQNINGIWSINSNSNLDDIKVFYNFYNPNSVAETSPKYILTDFNSGYQISLDDYDYIDTDILYKNNLLQVEANNVDNIKFSPSGCISINGKNTDYSMNLTFNNEYCTLPWYNINITGIKSNEVSVTQVDNGFILNGDNLIDVTVSAYNDSVSTSVNFDTFDNSVLIYAIDDYTIGIATYIEDNQSFKVDTTIAKSIEYSFDNSNKQSSIKGDLNYDGKLSLLDLLIQKKVVLGCINLSDISIGDLNGDNLLNILDVIILKRNILQG